MVQRHRPLVAPVMNRRAGSRLNKVEPYRVVVHISDANGSSMLPPDCFFSAALRALRASASERVLVLTDTAQDELISRIIRHIGGTNNTAHVITSPTADLVSGVLRAALRVVWGSSIALLPELMSRRLKPFEVVWTWCTPRRDLTHWGTSLAPLHSTSCRMLPQNLTDFEVQARWRIRMMRHAHADAAAASGARLLHGRDSHEDGHARGTCGGRVAIRSTWTGQQWHSPESDLPLPQTEIELPSKLETGEWMLENACLATRARNPPPNGTQRWFTLAQAHGFRGPPLWPLPWRDVYAEYAPGFFRFDSERIGHYLTNMMNMSSSPVSQCTWHSPMTAGFITTLTMDNLFHALVHAVPTREFFARVVGRYDAGSVHLLPHYLQYWPTSFASSVGWQLIARSLGLSATEWTEAAARAQAFAQTGCHCYARLYGGHRAWMPPPHMHQQPQRVLGFREALSASLHAPPAQARLLFQVRRNGVRQIVNERELRSAVEADAVCSGAVRFAVMEELTLLQQYRLISSSQSLAGVHGQGLAWSMLLASQPQGRSSCLEIIGHWPSFSRLDYRSTSLANNVHYLRLVQPNAPECETRCRRCNYRLCGNVTVEIATVMRTLHQMLRWLTDEQTPNANPRSG